MQRRKVWLLFTAVIVAVFAMVGCMPGTTPDKTPPDLSTPTVVLSSTNINQGDSVTVTVQVTATDKRSNLKEAVMKLSLMKPGENGFTQIATATVPFAAVKTGEASKAFQVDGTHFQTGGNYSFKVAVTASDVKGNVSSEKTASPSGTLHVQGASPSVPTITVTYPSVQTSLEDTYTVVPATFNVRVVGADADGDLVELQARLIAEGTQAELFNVTKSSSGTTTLQIDKTNITPTLGADLKADLNLITLARDSAGNTYTHTYKIRARKQDVAFIDGQWHVGNYDDMDAQAIGNFAETAQPDDLSSEETANYTLPFSVTKLRFRIYPSNALTAGSKVGLYIFSNRGDVFKKDEDYKRGEGTVVKEDGNYYVDIEFANLNADNAKWMAIYLEDFGHSSHDSKYPWYVWKIDSAAYSTAFTKIVLQDFGTVEDFYEGKPINLKTTLNAEILKSLDDLEIKFYGIDGTKTLEELVETLNTANGAETLLDQARSTLGWPADNSWRFAIRYHVKATYDEFDATLNEIKKANMLEDPDPKTVYAISDPVIGTTGNHVWYRYDATTGNRIASSFNDIIYYFGMPDSHTPSQHNKDLITDVATMSLSIYTEIVVVDTDNSDKVLFVADAALGAANRWIAEVEGNYKQYSINLSSSGKHLSVTSTDKDFPIFVDNTSPIIEVEYPTLSGTGKKYFGDRRPEELKTPGPSNTDLYDRIGVPMFFYDEIEIQSGQNFKFKASDEIALYDVAAIFTSDTNGQAYDTWRNNLPPVLNPNLVTVDMPMGYDFLYSSGNQLYSGEDYADRNKEDKPVASTMSKALYTDVYGEGVEGNFSIDDRFELYDNFTWSKVRELATTPQINVADEELYFNMKTETEYHTISVPSVEETYWVWLVARDRGAQDSWLFDYADDQVNIDPINDTQKVYTQDVRLNQNNRFTVEPNINSYSGGRYYESSDSEADAPVVVLLKVRAVSHSMNIQRLDIKEPCLVSYPNEWYSHSYNVLQLNNGEKVTEFDDFETTDLLPVDVYPVFKREDQDYDNGAKFGYNGDTGVTNPLNLNSALETQYYGDYIGVPAGPSIESVPVVGGNNSTTFRVKTHDDIRRVKIELIDTKSWTVEQYSANPHTVIASTEIAKDENSTFEDGKGKGGYWQWEINLKTLLNNVPTEGYYTIVAKAYEPGDADFYEQWQWPIFVDTKGPDIEMFRFEEEALGENSGRITDCATVDHLHVDKRVNPTDLICCPSTVERWVGFQIVDGGGLMIEKEKGYDASTLSNVAAVRSDRRYDLCMDAAEVEGDCGTFGGHKFILKADDSYYDLFQNENINNVDNLRLLGFPGNHPNVIVNPTPQVPSSLKYLNRGLAEYENLEATAPWHLYYTNTIWGAYDGSDWTRDPVAISEIVLLNNIDLLNGLWENNDDITKKYLEFSMRDELGNTGSWASWLKRKGIEALTIDGLETSGNCVDTTIVATLSSSAQSTPENISSASITEKATLSIMAGGLTGKTESVSFSTPAQSVVASFIGSDFLAPAMQVKRSVQIVAETENNTELAAERTIDATYAGNAATMKLEPLSNFLNIKEYLTQNGMDSLNALVRDSEKYVYAGFDGNSANAPVTVKLTTYDDNVDRYIATRTVSSSAWMPGTTAADLSAFATEVYTMQYDPSDATHFATETATITFSVAVNDCPEGRTLTDSLNIFYQNPDTFIVSVQASPATTPATAIEVELESDILWSTIDDLKAAFSFSANGIPLTIENVTGWNGALTTPGRGRKFLFIVNPFTPSSARAISKTQGSIMMTIDNIVGVSLGNINNLTSSGGQTLPALTAPADNADLTNRQVTFQWNDAVNPGVYLNKYFLYVKSNVQSAYTEYDSGKNLTNTLNLDNNREYSWYVVAEFVNGDRLQSVVRNFEILGDAPTAFNLLTPANGTTGVGLNTPVTWGASTDPDGGVVTYKVFWTNSPTVALTLGSTMNPNTTAATVSDVNGTTFVPGAGWDEAQNFWWNVMAIDDEGLTRVANTTGPWGFRAADETNPVAADTLATVNYVNSQATLTFAASDTGYGFNAADQKVAIAGAGNNVGNITCTNPNPDVALTGAAQDITVTVNFVTSNLLYNFPVNLTFTDVDGATVTATITAKDIAGHTAVDATEVFIDNVRPTITPTNTMETKLASGVTKQFIFALFDGAAVADATVLVDDSNDLVIGSATGTTAGEASITLTASSTAEDSGNATITVRATDTTGNATELDVVVTVNTEVPALVDVQFVRDAGNTNDYVKVWFDDRLDTTTFAATLVYETGSGTQSLFRTSAVASLTERDILSADKMYSFDLGQNLFTDTATQATLSSYEFYSYEYKNKIIGADATGSVVNE